MSAAVYYAGLVGKYVRMERDRRDDEPGEGTIGMECTVAAALDVPDKPGWVEIVSDYGYSFTITAFDLADGSWRFTIWPDEQTRKGMRI